MDKEIRIKDKSDKPDKSAVLDNLTPLSFILYLLSFISNLFKQSLVYKIRHIPNLLRGKN